MVLPLSHIPPASDARIIWIASEPARREKLARQGFVPDEAGTLRMSFPPKAALFIPGARPSDFTAAKACRRNFCRNPTLIFQKQMLNNFYQTQYNGKNFQQEET